MTSPRDSTTTTSASEASASGASASGASPSGAIAPGALVAAAVALVTVAVVSCAPALAAPAASPSDVGPERPVVLMLHGRGLSRSDTASLRRAWSRALDEGIESVAGDPLLRDDDLRLVWYADALEPGGEACPVERRGEDPSGPGKDEGGRGWAREIGATLGTAGTLMGLVARWMDGPEAEALEALAGDLVYLGDERRRCRAEERLARALATAEREGRPVILVAHSFGALVAYHHLRARAGGDAPRIERWITVGSLLGHPELRAILLTGGGGTGLPRGVGSWVNVRDPRDPLAAPLVGLRSAATDTTLIEDRTTESAPVGDPHSPARYLSDPATARAVLEAWCEAAGAVTFPCTP